MLISMILLEVSQHKFNGNARVSKKNLSVSQVWIRSSIVRSQI